MHSRRYTADTEFLKPSELTMDLSSAHETSKTLQASKNSLTPQAGHQGIVRRWLRAKVSVWWPDLSRQLTQFIERC